MVDLVTTEAEGGQEPNRQTDAEEDLARKARHKGVIISLRVCGTWRSYKPWNNVIEDITHLATIQLSMSLYHQSYWCTLGFYIQEPCCKLRSREWNPIQPLTSPGWLSAICLQKQLDIQPCPTQLLLNGLIQ